MSVMQSWVGETFTDEYTPKNTNGVKQLKETTRVLHLVSSEALFEGAVLFVQSLNETEGRTNVNLPVGEWEAMGSPNQITVRIQPVMNGA